MIPFEKVKTLFFDFDGTLHDTVHIYSVAFKKAYGHLVENGHVEPRDWKKKEIAYWLGFNSVEMWQILLPKEEEYVRKEASEIIAKEMKKQIQEKRATFYEGTFETLAYLKEKNYYMVFLSNCRTYYKDMFQEIFSLDTYFNEMICAEEYDFIPKYEILKKIKQNYSMEMVMIGDRKHDIETGKKNDIYTIGCKYGFGDEEELKEADFLIEDIRELQKYF